MKLAPSFQSGYSGADSAVLLAKRNWLELLFSRN